MPSGAAAAGPKAASAIPLATAKSRIETVSTMPVFTPGSSREPSSSPIAADATISTTRTPARAQYAADRRTWPETSQTSTTTATMASTWKPSPARPPAAASRRSSRPASSGTPTTNDRVIRTCTADTPWPPASARMGPATATQISVAAGDRGDRDRGDLGGRHAHGEHPVTQRGGPEQPAEGEGQQGQHRRGREHGDPEPGGQRPQPARRPARNRDG